uniref:Uncharacterized protein n=1 Tax=Quercus lobata TaxID=97700 RepID=A0A7N2KQN4_QUELO
MRVSLKKTETQLASAKKQIKLRVKELGNKDAEREKAEQAAYDAIMAKTAQSLTAQLRDVVRTFYLEVWGEALNAIGVGANSDLRGPSKVYYPLPFASLPVLLFPCQIQILPPRHLSP